MNIEVVTVGTELVLGLTPDTNAAELGQALAAAGFELSRHSAVPDRPDAIRGVVADALARTGIVIVTGGLGPTRDDITKHQVAALFGKPLVLDPAVLHSLEERFRRLGRPMPAMNRTQAEVPAGATVLLNPRGTAPGLWIEDGGRLAVLLPGVPVEMRGLLHEEVLPRLATRTGRATVVQSRIVRTTGVPESALAERLAGMEDRLAPLTLAYLPTLAGVDLRVTAWALGPVEAASRLEDAVRSLRDATGADAYGADDADLAAVVLERLGARGHTLAIAESCTGGMIAQRVTAIPGASQTFVGGVVAYDDRVKIELLDVAPALLAAHGAVSEQCVRAMVGGARRRFTAAAAIAVTGIAGPGGGTADKPVGTVWLAASSESTGERAVCRRFPGTREEIRARAAQAALDLLRRSLDAAGAP